MMQALSFRVLSSCGVVTRLSTLKPQPVLRAGVAAPFWDSLHRPFTSSVVVEAGHNKWSKIKHKKASTDAQKSKINTKLSNAISAAVRAAGPDTMTNLRLQAALDQAKRHNVAKDIVEGAIKRALEGKEGADYETVFYEGTGPAGTAFIVECLTDNRKRTAPAMRHLFTKHGGELGKEGMTAWQFTTVGLLTVNRMTEAEGDEEPVEVSEDEVMEVALEAGADDVVGGETSFEITCGSSETHRVRLALLDAGLQVASTELTRIPNLAVEVDESNSAFTNLLEELENYDDVQTVWHNAC